MRKLALGRYSPAHGDQSGADRSRVGDNQRRRRPRRDEIKRLAGPLDLIEQRLAARECEVFMTGLERGIERGLGPLQVGDPFGPPPASPRRLDQVVQDCRRDADRVRGDRRGLPGPSSGEHQIATTPRPPAREASRRRSLAAAVGQRRIAPARIRWLALSTVSPWRAMSSGTGVPCNASRRLAQPVPAASPAGTHPRPHELKKIRTATSAGASNRSLSSSSSLTSVSDAPAMSSDVQYSPT